MMGYVSRNVRLDSTISIPKMIVICAIQAVRVVQVLHPMIVLNVNEAFLYNWTDLVKLDVQLELLCETRSNANYVICLVRPAVDEPT
jgi:hypothetical protein